MDHHRHPAAGRSELERIADSTPTPLVVGETLYVAAYNGDLAALDLTSGAVLWRRALSSYAGLTEADGTLYVTDSNDLVWAAKPRGWRRSLEAGGPALPQPDGPGRGG